MSQLPAFVRDALLVQRLNSFIIVCLHVFCDLNTFCCGLMYAYIIANRRIQRRTQKRSSENWLQCILLNLIDEH